MHDPRMQPISHFTKSSHQYRIISILSLPATTSAMQEILMQGMSHQEFIVPNSLIQYFADTLQVSQRTIRTGLSQLEESKFIIDRGRKNCTINSFLANKYETIPRHLQHTVVDPNPCTPRQLEIIQKANIMKNYNHALNHPAYIQQFDEMALRLARDSIFNERMRKMEKRVEALEAQNEYLMTLVSAEEAKTARLRFELIDGGRK